MILVGLFAFAAVATLGGLGLVPQELTADLSLNVEYIKGFTAHLDGMGILATGGAVGALTKEAMETATKELREKITEVTKKETGELRENLEKQILELETKITSGEIAGKGVAEFKEESAKRSEANVKLIEEIEAKVQKFADDQNERFEKLEKGRPLGNDPSNNFGKGLGEAITASGMTSTKKGKCYYEFKSWPGRGYKDISTVTDNVYPREMVPGIIGPAQRQLRVRDLLPVLRTNNNTVWFVSETALTDNAGPQTLAATKGETTFQVTADSETVRTLAHFIQVPNQLLDDIEALEDYINSRMLFLLDQEEEDQLLYGNDTGQNLNGLITQATAFDTSLTTELGVTDVTDLDRLRAAIAQVQVAQYAPSGVLLHPYNWAGIELLKESTRGYVFANPHNLAPASIWGLPVVPTVAIASPDFLVGAFNIGAAIWDRQQAGIAISTEDSDNFQTNMATVRAEKRMTLTVYRTLSFVQGDFANTVT